ncbi:MAG: hypothetical protein SPL78_08935 [Bacteroidales bacterium]|nr:hypothetical protein [Bacteroidales bacterium]
MGKAFPEYLKPIICGSFPGLCSDSKFEITSPQDARYNCISWAMMHKDRWTQPPAGYPYLDGVFWWPPNALNGTDISCLVDAFVKEGYEICSSAEFEDDFVKVALYHNPKNNKWTHACRLLRTGVWASKLGTSFDIEHGSPYTIEGETYGKVYCIMRAPFHSHKK